MGSRIEVIVSRFLRHCLCVDVLIASMGEKFSEDRLGLNINTIEKGLYIPKEKDICRTKIK